MEDLPSGRRLWWWYIWGRRVIGISGSLIWSEPWWNWFFNPCGEFRWSPEDPVSQIHCPHLHVGAPGNFSDLLRSVHMLKREWGAKSNRELPHLSIHSKMQPGFLSFLWAELQPWFLSFLSLAEYSWWWYYNSNGEQFNKWVFCLDLLYILTSFLFLNDINSANFVYWWSYWEKNLCLSLDLNIRAIHESFGLKCE